MSFFLLPFCLQYIGIMVLIKSYLQVYPLALSLACEIILLVKFIMDRLMVMISLLMERCNAGYSIQIVVIETNIFACSYISVLSISDILVTFNCIGQIQQCADQKKENVYH